MGRFPLRCLIGLSTSTCNRVQVGRGGANRDGRYAATEVILLGDGGIIILLSTPLYWIHSTVQLAKVGHVGEGVSYIIH